MPTYVYETVPRDTKTKPIRFEVEQRMSTAALTQHPQTGEPVRRVISGGLGFIGCADKGGGSAGAGCTAPGCPHTDH
ncbi:MAG: zinc ribbon domain-containing protein [Planctomycetes bacterium]|nr:zinc ribbon domain-containing protein [Planctomycetota bacterium]